MRSQSAQEEALGRIYYLTGNPSTDVEKEVFELAREVLRGELEAALNESEGVGLREAILSLPEQRIGSGNSTWDDCEPIIYYLKSDVLKALAAKEKGTRST